MTLALSQHWRVDLLIRRKSNHIELWRVAWPSYIFGAIMLTILSYITATENYGWQRIIVDDLSGECVGYCATSDGTVNWSSYVVAVLLLVPIAHAGGVAYKTFGMDELYSDSKWVLIYILLQFQVRVLLHFIPSVFYGGSHIRALF